MNASGVTHAAPRIDPRLVFVIERLDRLGGPIADTNRRVGVVAEWLGVPRPSYEQVRTIVHAARKRRLASPGIGRVLLDVSLRARPPEHVLDALAGTLPPPAQSNSLLLGR